MKTISCKCYDDRFGDCRHPVHLTGTCRYAYNLYECPYIRSHPELLEVVFDKPNKIPKRT